MNHYQKEFRNKIKANGRDATNDMSHNSVTHSTICVPLEVFFKKAKILFCLANGGGWFLLVSVAAHCLGGGAGQNSISSPSPIPGGCFGHPPIPYPNPSPITWGWAQHPMQPRHCEEYPRLALLALRFWDNIGSRSPPVLGSHNETRGGATWTCCHR